MEERKHKRKDLEALRFNLNYWMKIKHNLETIPDAYDPATMIALNNIVDHRIDELKRVYHKAQKGPEKIIKAWEGSE